jgi:hypothetical protein
MFDFNARKKLLLDRPRDCPQASWKHASRPLVSNAPLAWRSKGLGMITGSRVTQRIRPKGRWCVIGGQVNPDAWRHMQHY